MVVGNWIAFKYIFLSTTDLQTTAFYFYRGYAAFFLRSNSSWPPDLKSTSALGSPEYILRRTREGEGGGCTPAGACARRG